MSPRLVFEKELRMLKEHVTDMAKQVEKNYDNLFHAYDNKAEEEILCMKTLDKEINKRQREIESECLFLITKQQPIVGDLRVVTASLKVVTDMERIGDHIADMAELLLRMHQKELESYSVHLLPMIQETRKMIHTAVCAFVERDILSAKEVIQADDVVDNLFNRVKDDLILSLKKEAKDADECVDVLMLAKYLEKIGDHAVNIAEWEIFQETGNIDNIRLL